MISRREWIAFVVALVVVILSRGNLPVALLAGMAAWLVQIEKPPQDYMTRERRYRMRETERRNRMVERWRKHL